MERLHSYLNSLHTVEMFSLCVAFLRLLRSCTWYVTWWGKSLLNHQSLYMGPSLAGIRQRSSSVSDLLIIRPPYKIPEISWCLSMGISAILQTGRGAKSFSDAPRGSPEEKWPTPNNLHSCGTPTCTSTTSPEGKLLIRRSYWIWDFQSNLSLDTSLVLLVVWNLKFCSSL